MLALLLNGVLFGISLSFMVGPLLFGLVETSIERGFRAGVAVASGMWTSDVAYVAVIIYGLDAFAGLTALPHFRVYASILGGSMLCLFGLFGLLGGRKAVARENSTVARSTDKLLDALDGSEQPGDPPNWTAWGLVGFWLRGLLMNTLNPGTIFFWLGIATALVVPSQWSAAQTATFFGGMLATTVVTDVLKVYAAKRLRHFLTPAHVLQVRRGIGLLLMAFGAFLMVRVL